MAFAGKREELERERKRKALEKSLRERERKALEKSSREKEREKSEKKIDPHSLTRVLPPDQRIWKGKVFCLCAINS